MSILGWVVSPYVQIPIDNIIACAHGQSIRVAVLGVSFVYLSSYWHNITINFVSFLVRSSISDTTPPILWCGRIVVFDFFFYPTLIIYEKQKKNYVCQPLMSTFPVGEPRRPHFTLHGLPLQTTIFLSLSLFLLIYTKYQILLLTPLSLYVFFSAYNFSPSHYVSHLFYFFLTQAKHSFFSQYLFRPNAKQMKMKRLCNTSSFKWL